MLRGKLLDVPVRSPFFVIIRLVILLAMAIGPMSSAAWAQGELQLAAIEFDYVPQTDLKSADVQTQSLSFRFTGLVPVPLTRKTILILAPLYRYWRFESTGASDVTAHQVGVTAIGRHKLRGPWTLLGTFGLGVASDFVDVNLGHSRIVGSLTGQYQFNSGLSIGAGIAGNYTFGSFLPVPLVLLDWKVNPTVRVLAALPQKMSVAARLHDRWQVGFGLRIDGNRFSTQPAAPEVESVAISQGTAALRVEVKLLRGFWFELHVGRTFLRRLEFFDSNNTSIADFSPTQAFVGGGALTFRVQVPPS